MDTDKTTSASRAQIKTRIERADYDADVLYYETMTDWYKHGVFARRINNLISDGKFLGQDILDAGCGVGSMSVECALRDRHVISLDYSMTALRFSKSNALNSGVANRIVPVAASVEQLPFIDNQFDTVIAADVIEHIYDPQLFFRELYRVLKPGGFAILETPNIEFMAFPGHKFLGVARLLLPFTKSRNRTPVPTARFSVDYHVN